MDINMDNLPDPAVWSPAERLSAGTRLASTSSARSPGGLLDAAGGTGDDGRDFLGMRLVDRVAGVRDDGRMALGAFVVPAFEIGIDDLVAACDDAPARLGLPCCRRQRRAEHLRGSQNLGPCGELRPLAR